LDDVCMRALRQNPAQRYMTAADFAESLENAAAAARIPVATSRAVAAFVKDLKLPQMEVPPDASRGIIGPAPSERGLAAPALSDSGRSPRPALSVKRDDASTSSGPTGPTGATQIGASLSSPPPRRKRRGLLLFAILCAAGIGAGLFFAGR